tara:strand:- start:19371 stop:21152 length:1782 start_codon:yes stop_codon:yes gene_type:complete
MVFALLALLAFLASFASAQPIASSNVAEFSVVRDRLYYPAGGSFKLLFRLDIADKWHTQSHDPSMKSLIATEVKLKPSKGVVFGRIVYPPGIDEKFDYFETPLSTYKGVTFIGVSGTVDSSLKQGPHTAQVELIIQACNDKTCLPPSTLKSTINFRVVAEGTKINFENRALFKSNKALFSFNTNDLSSNGDIKTLLQSSGFMLTFAFVFLGGLALNLTPCVYPLIPITVSYFGGQENSTKGKLVLNAFMYLLGIATMYSTLGVLAAITGDMFGSLLQHSAVIILLAMIMVCLGLSMFGLYEIRFPSFIIESGSKSKDGIFASLFMGLTAGIVAAPCVGPFVLGLLTFVSEQGDPVLGFTLFFTLAMGLGMPFVLLAIFSGSLATLPKSGEWMLWIRHVFGFVLIGMAFYFLAPLISNTIYWICLSVFMVIAGIFLGWISRVEVATSGFKFFRKTFGLLVVTIGVFFLSFAQADLKIGISWEEATIESVEEAKLSGRPVILDFSADWCLPCKELDHFTFTNSEVIRLSKRFLTYKVDLTSSNNAEAEALKKEFGVLGVPTIVFIDKNGNVLKPISFVGFIDAKELLKKMAIVLG